jgi:hypothetical protein
MSVDHVKEAIVALLKEMPPEEAAKLLVEIRSFVEFRLDELPI